MKLDDYDVDDGKRVWLSTNEFEKLTRRARDSRRTLAFLLGGRSGLRRSELVDLTYENFTNAEEGFVRVWDGKGAKYREPPVPDEVVYRVDALADSHEPDDRVIDVSDRTVNRWLGDTAGELHAETDDPGWSYLTMHDLRRTWASWLIYERGAMPMVVFRWGGWTDWQTFKNSYLGELSPEAARREREQAYGTRDPDTRVTTAYSGGVETPNGTGVADD